MLKAILQPCGAIDRTLSIAFETIVRNLIPQLPQSLFHDMVSYDPRTLCGRLRVSEVRKICYEA